MTPVSAPAGVAVRQSSGRTFTIMLGRCIRKSLQSGTIGVSVVFSKLHKIYRISDIHLSSDLLIEGLNVEPCDCSN